MYKLIHILVLTGIGRSILWMILLSGGMASAAPMREMTTDRPDATESPFTVPPGRVQLELDFGGYTRDRESGVRQTEWQIMPFNLRIGVGRDFELGLFVAPQMVVTETVSGGLRVRRSGFGDLILRAKWNGAGNDVEGLAWGVISDLKLPTAADGLSNDQVEGALTLPLAFDLGLDWSGGAMTGVEWVRSTAWRDRIVWVNTLAAGRDLSENTGFFLELTSATGDGPHVATFNCGLTRRFGPDVQLDGGVNLGLSRVAPDLGVFVGLARRF